MAGVKRELHPARYLEPPWLKTVRLRPSLTLIGKETFTGATPLPQDQQTVILAGAHPGWDVGPPTGWPQGEGGEHDEGVDIAEERPGADGPGEPPF